MSSDSEKSPEDFDRLFALREGQDTADLSAAPRDDEQENSSAIDATCMYQANEADKKERDVAFAMCVLESGRLTERQLTSAIKDWTIHGNQPLSEHLIRKQLLSKSTVAQLDDRSDTRLQEAKRQSSLDGEPARNDLSNSVYARLDSDGRVLKLVGLSAATPSDPANDFRRDTTAYKLIRKLGQGGMGTVWLARDEQLGRLVAVKEVRRGVRDSEVMLHRFRREAQVTGRLEHPSIVPVHQLGQHVDDGNAFYVMRFLGKRTLEDAIVEYHERLDAGDQNPMHLRHLLTAFVTVCQAIAYAHSRHVVHRDLKPENIALDEYGQVIVLDWGLAKLTGRGELQELFGDLELNELSTHDDTTAGQVLGSPMYMAPEQAAGRNDEIEQTTDIYGLGAILFAILTGYAPHEKSLASSTSTSKVTELLQTIVSSPAPRARSLNANVPPELDAICAKATANKRYARYATAVELAEDVQRWMAAEPVSTYVEPWRKRMRRWMGTHRGISQLAGVLLTVVLVSAVTLGVTAHQNRQAAQRARFEDLKADGRELEVSLSAVTQDLGKDARFMAALPPIQAIINVREGIDKEEDEDVWRGRLQMIYRGLLEANPNYLSATYSSVGEGLTEIVRVERRSAGSYVRGMPASRLATRETTGLMTRVLRLKPDDLGIDITSLAHQRDAVNDPDGLVLTAGIPVYGDATGEIFGTVTIETDVEKTIRELLIATVEAGENAYIVDNDGTVLLHYSRERDFQRLTVGKNIGALIEGTEQFFSPDDVTDQFSDERRTYGIKIQLDPRSISSIIGIVLTLEP